MVSRCYDAIRSKPVGRREVLASCRPKSLRSVRGHPPGGTLGLVAGSSLAEVCQNPDRPAVSLSKTYFAM